jgi:alanine racemase
VEVDGAALRHNLRAMAAATGRPVIPVVKANAYGHGLVHAARALQGVQAGQILAVGTPEEARELRESGIAGRVLVMGYSDPEEVIDLVQRNVEMVAWTDEQLDRVAAAARRFETAGRVHLYVDVGMGRFGCTPAAAGPLLASASARRELEVCGVMGHLPSVDESLDVSREHVQVFRAVRDRLVTAAGRPLTYHLTSSTAVDVLPEGDFDAVRPGLAVYGAVETTGRLAGRLRPALSWYARIEDLTFHSAGEALGYGGEYVCADDRELVAVVGVGYADGFHRVPKGVNRVLLDSGQAVAVVGRVCTQHVLVRIPVGEQSKVRVGSRVTLLGTAGTSHILAPDLARAWGTNAWDVICNIGSAVPRTWTRMAQDVQLTP